ncbi:type II CAAX endopeptidase family protein [uncultured Psychroserpens sp.]|uniref:CPBP family intramembrane glutamic endopeptidase n=1 Tax=uncultured Psychroserpens sp. TaxID=255436 RepID=UPI0026361DED|nr:type II CAAX endopeptidase family protein [uncultured Psychroserpens sp.]
MGSDTSSSSNHTMIKPHKAVPFTGILLDLIIYISVMFLIRELAFPNVNFLVNGLSWSFTTLAIASWRMHARGISWYDLGLRKPKNIKKMLLTTILILVSTVVSLLLFNIIKDQIPFFASPETASVEETTSKFGNLKDNWPLFFTIIIAVLIESTLEELLDRGFLMNWFEKLFSKTTIATILAVLLQAVIFGFRHSYDLSERSITVGIIGLIMGIAYYVSGRNLWALIIAHCILNTLSMVDRVL